MTTPSALGELIYRMCEEKLDIHVVRNRLWSYTPEELKLFLSTCSTGTQKSVYACILEQCPHWQTIREYAIECLDAFAQQGKELDLSAEAFEGDRIDPSLKLCDFD